MSEHPFVPGDFSAIEKGPWHYGADYLAVYFKADESKLVPLVPKPFNVAGGESIAYVCEIISVSDAGEEMIGDDPARTFYGEAAIGVRCAFESKNGVFYPVMWVTTEWALLRGLLNGYQKRLADTIRISRLHPLNPGVSGIGPGSRRSGYCIKGKRMELDVKVEAQRKGSPADLPSFGPTFGMRRFPKTHESQGEVWEAVEILKSNSRADDVWIGEGSFVTSLDLGDIKVTGASAYRSGFTISGSRVLKRMQESL